MIVYISDFFGDIGGAEYTDKALMESIGHQNVYPWKSSTTNLFIGEPKEDRYILSNHTGLSDYNKLNLIEKANYIMIEHDHQYTPSRNPYIFNPEGLVPKNQLIDLDLYNNAKAIFCQTDHHRDMLIKNGIGKNVISMGSTLYSKQELLTWKYINGLNKHLKRIQKSVILDHSHPWKGRDLAIKLCLSSNRPYELLGGIPHEEFLLRLSKYEDLVFLPQTPESCCRLVTEARVFGLGVITTPTYGAPTSKWYELSGKDLINELEALNKKAIKEIKSYL